MERLNKHLPDLTKELREKLHTSIPKNTSRVLRNDIVHQLQIFLEVFGTVKHFNMPDALEQTSKILLAMIEDSGLYWRIAIAGWVLRLQLLERSGRLTTRKQLLNYFIGARDVLEAWSPDPKQRHRQRPL